MGKLLKSLLVIILTLVIIAALAVGGVWAFCYFKYDVNVFSVASALNKVSSIPKESDIVNNKPTKDDQTAVMNDLNSALCFGSNKIITYDEETDKYNVVFDNANKPILEDLVLTDKECCALFDMILSSRNPTIDAGGKTIKFSDYDFRLLQFDFADHQIITAGDKTTINSSFQVISSVSLLEVKKQMNTFPLSLLKKKVPDTLYISSTVTVSMEQGTISYTVESKALNLNKVKHSELQTVFKLLNNFVQIGDVDSFNKQIGSVFVNLLLGNSESEGFAYSLKDNNVASGFAFTPSGDDVVLTIYHI